MKHFLGLKKTKASPAATVAALRVLGFLEDESVVPALLDARDGRASARPRCARRRSSRCASWDAARGGEGRRARRPPKAAGAVAAKVMAVAETAPLPTARAALYTLACLPLPGALAARLGKLAAHAEAERARLATERLAQMPGPEASRALGQLLQGTRERALAEAAATALAARPDAGAVLARALLDAPDADRAGLFARLLRPHLRALDAKTTRAVREAAVERLAAGKPAPLWEPLLQRRARRRRRRDGRGAARRGREAAQDASPSARWRRCARSAAAPTRRPTTATPGRRSSSPRAGATRPSRSSASSPSAASISRRRCAATAASTPRRATRSASTSPSAATPWARRS